jgi:hypothetical protein
MEKLAMQMYGIYGEMHKNHREQTQLSSQGLVKTGSLSSFISANNLLNPASEATVSSTEPMPENAEPSKDIVTTKPVASHRWSALKVLGISIVSLAAIAGAGWMLMQLDSVKSTVAKGIEIGKNFFDQCTPQLNRAKSLLSQAIDFIAQHVTLENMKNTVAKGAEIGKRFFEQHAPKLEDVKSLLTQAKEAGERFTAQYLPIDSVKSTLVKSAEVTHHFVKRPQIRLGRP